MNMVDFVVAGAVLLVAVVVAYVAGASDWFIGLLMGLAAAMPLALMAALRRVPRPEPRPAAPTAAPQVDHWYVSNSPQRLIDLADAGAIVGLGNNRTRYTVDMDAGGTITVRLERPVTRQEALAVWDGVQLATGCCDVVVIDGDCQEVSR